MTTVRGWSRSWPRAGCTPTVPWDTCDASTWQDGKVLWQRNTYEDFNSKKEVNDEPPEGYFGIGSSPIVEGDKVLVNVGGDTRQAGIVALAADTGRTVWKATAERASYSSPVAVTVGGVRHVIFVTRLSVVSLDPDNGKVRFQFPFGRIGTTVNGASPVVFDGHLFVTASYRIGSVFAKISGGDAEVLVARSGNLWQASIPHASKAAAICSASTDGRTGRWPNCDASIRRPARSSGRSRPSATRP